MLPHLIAIGHHLGLGLAVAGKISSAAFCLLQKSTFMRLALATCSYTRWPWSESSKGVTLSCSPKFNADFLNALHHLW